MRQAERRSLVRVCPAMVLGDKPGVRAEEIIKTWGDEGAFFKAAQTPTSTSFYPQLQTTARKTL